MKNDMYTAVAKNCSSFNPKSSMFSSSAMISEPTCKNCRHFENQHCNKDLYDEIVDSFSM